MQIECLRPEGNVHKVFLHPSNAVLSTDRSSEFCAQLEEFSYALIQSFLPGFLAQLTFQNIHMQIAIAQELEGLPTFRTQTNFNAYAEGWGLYAEWLATEIDGTYLDPYSEFGRLGSEMWRAIRLVVDTGLHAKGWTEDEANAYFLDNGPITEAQARSEVRRYIVMPGQATGYKIGMLRIQALRRKAEAALGEAFDIRVFHDTILGGGAMPLTLLGAGVNRWIAEAQGSDA